MNLEKITAINLIEHFYEHTDNFDSNGVRTAENAKQCALKCIRMIILNLSVIDKPFTVEDKIQHLQKVKLELEKL